MRRIHLVNRRRARPLDRRDEPRAADRARRLARRHPRARVHAEKLWPAGHARRGNREPHVADERHGRHMVADQRHGIGRRRNNRHVVAVHGSRRACRRFLPPRPDWRRRELPGRRNAPLPPVSRRRITDCTASPARRHARLRRIQPRQCALGHACRSQRGDLRRRHERHRRARDSAARGPRPIRHDRIRCRRSDIRHRRACDSASGRSHSIRHHRRGCTGRASVKQRPCRADSGSLERRDAARRDGRIRNSGGCFNRHRRNPDT